MLVCSFVLNFYVFISDLIMHHYLLLYKFQKNSSPENMESSCFHLCYKNVSQKIQIILTSGIDYNPTVPNQTFTNCTRSTGFSRKRKISDATTHKLTRITIFLNATSCIIACDHNVYGCNVSHQKYHTCVTTCRKRPISTICTCMTQLLHLFHRMY